MRLDRLTSKFQIAISDAQSLALGRDHQFIEPIHLMLALLNQEGGSIRPLLTLAGADVSTLRSRLTQELDRLPKVSGVDGDVHDDVARQAFDGEQVDQLAVLVELGVALV
jgi:ATP-dependent Clp protease ATP-binding subunit ClpB